MALYEKHFANKGSPLRDDDTVDQIVNDPKKRAVFSEVLSALVTRGARGIDPAVKKSRAIAGGKARAKMLSPEERKAISEKGTIARWGKKK